MSAGRGRIYQVVQGVEETDQVVAAAEVLRRAQLEADVARKAPIGGALARGVEGSLVRVDDMMLVPGSKESRLDAKAGSSRPRATRRR